MSLINDALKKAQRERTGPVDRTGAPLPSGTPAPAGHAPYYEPRPRSNPWPALLVVLALIGGGAAVWFLKPGAAATPAVQVATAPQPAPAVPTPALPVAPPPEAPPPQLQINLPGTTTAPATPPPAAPVPAPAPATPQPAALPAPAAAQPAPFQVTLQLEDPRILAFLDGARINGVRVAADDAKLLMNNKVFRAGDVVDRELSLKVVRIHPSELVFEDQRGIQYKKLL